MSLQRGGSEHHHEPGGEQTSPQQMHVVRFGSTHAVGVAGGSGTHVCPETPGTVVPRFWLVCAGGARKADRIGGAAARLGHAGASPAAGARDTLAAELIGYVGAGRRGPWLDPAGWHRGQQSKRGGSAAARRERDAHFDSRHARCGWCCKLSTFFGVARGTACVAARHAAYKLSHASSVRRVHFFSLRRFLRESSMRRVLRL